MQPSAAALLCRRLPRGGRGGDPAVVSSRGSRGPVEGEVTAPGRWEVEEGGVREGLRGHG